MLLLKRLEIEGFGPFAQRQEVVFPADGVTAIYGDNMRGKTSLLNAIRFAFFGEAVGRGSRPRQISSLINRDLVADGQHQFSVSLVFDYDGQEYEVVRECRPSIAKPISEFDYKVDLFVRRGNSTLGPDEKESALRGIFPAEIARFFLFDGELLQEYEELLINESNVGKGISEAIERILGVPLLKKGRQHLRFLMEEAEAAAAREAKNHQQTQQLGSAIEQATTLRDQHRREIARKEDELKKLTARKLETEAALRAQERFRLLLDKRDEAQAGLAKLSADLERRDSEIMALMASAWRTVLTPGVREARLQSQQHLQSHLDGIGNAFRAKAVDSGHCPTCERALNDSERERLRQSLAAAGASAADATHTFSRLAQLNAFGDTDNAGEIRHVWQTRVEQLRERVSLQERLEDIAEELQDADADSIRTAQTTYKEVMEQIAIIRGAIDQETKDTDTLERDIQKLQKRLRDSGTPNLQASQRRAQMVRECAEIFDLSIERYKNDLRHRVEATSSQLFKAMTTEKQDYAALAINESYGLTIMHRDGKAEFSRSAGAEHIVALALMGALQRNAPLRGPIVMDSPFGRLDASHTANVVRALPMMAEQLVLLVHENEVGRGQVRDLLGSELKSEYQLERVSGRRTNIARVR